MDAVLIRPVRSADDPALETIIQRVTAEFGPAAAEGPGRDPEVRAMSAAYDGERSVYLVAERGGAVLGGAGVGPLRDAAPETCELRKMYLVREARGLGIGRRLLEACLETARALGYRRCYLETLAGMDAARRLYEDAGFRSLPTPEGRTGHCGCDRWYAREL